MKYRCNEKLLILIQMIELTFKNLKSRSHVMAAMKVALRTRTTSLYGQVQQLMKKINNVSFGIIVNVYEMLSVFVPKTVYPTLRS